jgi:hypothetical protein
MTSPVPYVGPYARLAPLPPKALLRARGEAHGRSQTRANVRTAVSMIWHSLRSCCTAHWRLDAGVT